MIQVFTTNTFYPPGTICAKEQFNQFCPTSGESGNIVNVMHEFTDQHYVEAWAMGKNFYNFQHVSNTVSGSPLMTESSESRLTAEGILSFVKGCSRYK